MDKIADTLLGNSFTKTLVDSLPCGLLVVDKNGRVQLVNNILERVLKVHRQAVIGKATGDILSCVHETEHPKGCGSADCCGDCEIQNLTYKALATNLKQKTRAHLQLIINGQIRDLSLLLSVFPFTFNAAPFCMLILENIGVLKAFSETATEQGFRGIVGRSNNMQDLFDTIKQVAQTDASVLIQGESGTGKELVALAVHKESPRARNHFVPVNCGALPEGLLESELFGHVKGAFTGAHRDRKGRFELADGGTIFLDEVGELDSATQVKLLRVLQDGAFEPVGSESTRRVNVRIISATNKKLEEEVVSGRFRKDLYYRLCVMPVLILPLRDRKEDLPLLVEHFLEQFSDESHGRQFTLSPTALSLITSHTWPGNVRELKNTIQFALAKCRGFRIEPKHLPPVLQNQLTGLNTRHYRELKLNTALVAKALAKTGGNKLRAAEVLDVSRSTLYRFLAKQSNA